MIIERINLFDIPICNVSLEEAVDIILRHLENGKAIRIYFVNAHCVNLSREDSDYFRILQEADYVFADGVGMQLAAKVMGKPLRDNVNGTDLYPRLCESLSTKSYRMFLLGAEAGVAEQTKLCTEEEYPHINICGVHHGYFPDEDEGVVRYIQEAQAELLLVAMGVPRQEKWIEVNYQKVGAKVTIGVGGLFDFYSRKTPRAPRWMRMIGLEWLFRMYQEPQRLWRRYLLGNCKFLWLIIKGKIS